MKKIVMSAFMLGLLFLPKISSADILGGIFGGLFGTDITSKYYSGARENWHKFFDNPGVTPMMSPQALADFNSHIDLSLHKVVNRYPEDWEKANHNEWPILAELNRAAKSTWDAIVQCAGGDTNRARNLYLNMQLCPDSRGKLAQLKIDLNAFLDSSDVQVPSSRDVDEWLYSGGLQFHPLLIQLALEEIAIGYRYPDLAKCVSPCNPWINGAYDVEWWKPWDQHREAPFWHKVHVGQPNQDLNSIAGGGFDTEKMNRMDPDVRQFIRAVHATMMVNLLRRAKDQVCVQWGLWPQYTNVFMRAISGLSNIHGLAWDGYTFLGFPIQQECGFVWTPPPTGASLFMIEVIDAQAWSAMAAFHAQALR